MYEYFLFIYLGSVKFVFIISLLSCFSHRLTLTLSCPMSLENFPLDSQLCFIVIESYGYPVQDLFYYWELGEKSVQIAEDFLLPQHLLLNHSLLTLNKEYATGSYTQLLVKILLTRQSGFYLIQYYIPAALIVLVSFLALWLDRSATVERVALGFTMILTVTTLMSSANNSLPKVSYIKAIDIYLAICFAFVFSVLLEFIVGGYIGKRLDRRQKSRIRISQSDCNCVDLSQKDAECGKSEDKESEVKCVNATKIDICSRFAFPFTFGLFQLIYWLYYWQEKNTNNNMDSYNNLNWPRNITQY